MKLYDDWRTEQTAAFLSLGMNALQDMRTPIPMKLNQLNSYLWDSSMSPQDKQHSIVAHLELFVPEMEAHARENKAERKPIQDFLNIVRDRIPELIGLWKHYDTQKHCLEKLIHAIHPYAPVKGPHKDIPELEVKLGLLMELCENLMALKIISKDDAAQVIQLAAEFYEKGKLFQTQEFRDIFEDALTDFEVVNMIREIN